MPSYCCVPECTERSGGHTFPKDKLQRCKWIVAIKRVDPVTKKPWKPSNQSVVCRQHFAADDYSPSLLGERPRLRAGAVPSIFSFRKPSSQSQRDARMQIRKKLEFGTCSAAPDVEDLGCEMEIETESLDGITSSCIGADEECTVHDVDTGIQCELLKEHTSGFSISNFKENADAIKYYTGFDCYMHFLTFFSVLGPAVNHLSYQCILLNPVDQLFLTLMKLRQGKDDIELGLLFKLSLATVARIFNVWVNFMYFQLKELNTWPSKELVDLHMPLDFGKQFRNTRVILDATETPIQKPADVNSQSATFSSYKHRNTLKTMIGISPRGVVSYVSDSYGGSVSDRQIIERSELVRSEKMFEKKDSIMADKGILVQDLFCAKDVHVNTPTVLKKKSQLEPEEVVRDRRVSSKRIHVERVIGLSKTFKILKRELTTSKLPIASRIVFICFSISNFRPSIVGRLA